ncbi:hypothetical protein LPJ53_005513 [Coemansia erecta]|uniref:RNA polymerase II assembly factor Rtp1 C-terminal domain-containing protein n=1 Tax=Coemansia erecta TaxID=147472 RepID=A0A9W8CQ51_9FUNG|nr:hypothetical protein LPJ53_005513 [Coemansia erecta]
MADDIRYKVSAKYPSLPHLSTLVSTTLSQLKNTAKQLSKGGTSQDLQVIAAAQPPPLLEMLSLLEQLQQEIRDAGQAVSDDGYVDALGLRDRQVVAQAIDIVVVFGVHPRLLPGIGVPLDQRVGSQSAAVLAQTLQRQFHSPIFVSRLTPSEDDLRLPSTTLRLAHIIRNKVKHGTADVAHALLGKCTNDLLAALLQTAYAPLPPPNTQPPAGYLENIETQETRRIELRKEFTWIFDACSPFVLLETLTTLLNAAVSHRPQPGPKWFITLCSRFLSRVLLRPAGARIMVDFFVANDEDITAQKLERITSLLLTPAAGAKPDEYYAAIVPQIVEMADSSKEKKQEDPEDVVGEVMNANAVQQRVAQVATYAMQRLADKDVSAFKLHVADPTVSALLRWFTTRKLSSANNTSTETASSAVASNEAADPVLRGLRGNSTAKPLIQVIEEPPQGKLLEETGGPEVSSANDLNRSLDQIGQLVLQGVPSVPLLATLVVPVFAPLLDWYAYETARPDREQTREVLRDVLVATLAGLPQSATISTVLDVIQLVRGESADESEETSDRDWTVFAVRADPENSTRLIWRSADITATADEQQLVPIDALLEILGMPELGTYLGDIFVTLLREQQALLELVSQGNSGGGVAVGIPGLVRKWWAVSQATLAMVERFGPAVLTKHADVLAFIFDTLERSAEVFGSEGSGQGGQDAEPPSIETLIESLNVGVSGRAKEEEGAAQDAEDEIEGRLGSTELVVLALMLLGQVLTASEQQAFSAMAPSLAHKIPGATPDGASPLPTIVWNGEALRHLRGILAQLKRLESQRASAAVGRLAGEVKLQAVMVLALHGGDKQAAGPKGGDVADAADAEVRRFNAAVRDIRDELVPVRAHGIIELRNMVLAKSSALHGDRLDATIGIFIDMAKSADSFVYLNAIRGLSALADAHGRRFIPRLVAMYCGLDQEDSGALSLDEHVRVGEALLQSVRRAGMMLGEYAALVVPGLLAVVQQGDEGRVDEERVVRRHSALAILAMCAETCPLALQRWVSEITSTLEDILLVEAGSSGDAAVVRRAAVVVWQSLVRGYGERVGRLVEPDELRRIYRVLRRVAEGDSDEITRLQAQIAVADLDELVRGQLLLGQQYL